MTSHDGLVAGGEGSVRPVSPGARHELIDIVRGFALYGVLLANLVWTTQWVVNTWDHAPPPPTALLDGVAGFLVVMFVDYKFYTLFSALFGLGFAVQLSRMTTGGGATLGTYSRRLMILFVLGMLHALLVWFGDILHVYALLGFTLLLFRNASDRVVLWCALGVAALTALMPTMGWLLHGPELEPTEAARAMDEAKSARRYAAMSEGTYADVVALNWDVVKGDYVSGEGIVYWYLSVFWKMLIGFWVGRRATLQNAAANRAMFRRILPWALGAGLAGNLLFATTAMFFDLWLPEEQSWLALLWIPVSIGIPALSAAYVCVLALLFLHPKGRATVQWLAPIGRTALSNYLTQSALLIVVWYGVGFGLVGRAGTGVCVALSVVIFGVQAWLSAAWLKRYRFGPAEWAWRSLTYGRAQPMRMNVASSTVDA